MANEAEELSNFSIQDTMDMGTGDAQLLNDLFEPETSTSDPEKIEKIVKEVKQPVIPPVEKPKGKEIVQKEEGDAEQDVLKNFLGDAEEEGEGEEVASEIESVDEEQLPEDNETQFTTIAKELTRLGVFTKDEEDDVLPKSPEEFLERFKEEKKKGAIEIVNNFISQFGQDHQDAFEAIFAKGVNPREYYGIYNNVVSFAELDLSIEDNQVKVMRQALTDQGFEQEDITSEIDRLKNYGDLETVSAKHHKALVKKEASKLKEIEINAERELQQKAAIKNQYIQNVQQILQDKLKAKEFDGIPLNGNLVKELQDFLLVDKYKTVSGETLTDFDKTILELKRPENHEMKVKVGLLLQILKKDPTLSTIQRSAVTKKTDQLFGDLARQKTKTVTSPQKTTNKSWFS
jgi:hypothetical protein